MNRRVLENELQERREFLSSTGSELFFSSMEAYLLRKWYSGLLGSVTGRIDWPVKGGKSRFNLAMAMAMDTYWKTKKISDDTTEVIGWLFVIVFWLVMVGLVFWKLLGGF